jgi:UPF0716 family protein affecting phage T7 exclusion
MISLDAAVFQEVAAKVIGGVMLGVLLGTAVGGIYLESKKGRKALDEMKEAAKQNSR